MFQGNIDKIVQDILTSYKELGGINHTGGINLPSRESITRILRELEALIFPGFQDTVLTGISDLPLATTQGVLGCARLLITEVGKSLAYRARQAGTGGSDIQEQAEGISYGLLSKIPQLRAQISEDVQAFFEGDPAARSTDEIVLSYPGLEAILVYRIAHLLHLDEVPLIPRMMSEYIHRKTGIDIHPGAQIGRRFFIDHGTGVVIGETSVIGEGVKIYQGVTLGALSVKKSLASTKRHPTIGDNVTIYAGATILGGETLVGSGSVIGGNVWLTKSVPPYSVITMPAQDPVVGSKELNVIDFQI